MASFRALVIDKAHDGVAVAIRDWSTDRLMDGEVTIRVEYSSVNYKDGLAAISDGRVVRSYPLILGVDVAGTVVASTDERHATGDKVIAHGYEIGVAHHGGFAELARVPAAWAVPLPAGLTTRQAMTLGTAGFTAALSVARLEAAGLAPHAGTVIVTGSSGGVGSTAVDILAARGYTVAASTGSTDAHDFLRDLGATEILDRAETSAESGRPLERPRWAGAIDAVGGPTFAYLLRTMEYGASIAISGNTGGAPYASTVFPFILRAANVLGIDSVALPLNRRIEIWQRLATDLRPPHLDTTIAHEVSLDETPDQLTAILRGATRGRTIVRISN